MEICIYWISLTKPCTSMQGGDHKKAMHWLVIAERCDLQKLASKIISFIADSGDALSTFPGFQHLSSTVLLRLLAALHLRHTTAQIKASLAAVGKEVEYLEMKLVHEDKQQEDIERSLSRGMTAARCVVETQMRQCQRHLVCRKCKNREDPCQACGNSLSTS